MSFRRQLDICYNDIKDKIRLLRNISLSICKINKKRMIFNLIKFFIRPQGEKMNLIYFQDLIFTYCYTNIFPSQVYSGLINKQNDKTFKVHCSMNLYGINCKRSTSTELISTFITSYMYFFFIVNFVIH